MNRLGLILVGLCLPLIMVGCDYLDTSYASYRSKSINGIYVFAEMLRAKEHKVDVWPNLGDHLYQGYDVVIVFQDEVMPMSEEASYEIWDLLWWEANSVLFVGRDFDVTGNYWNTISNQLKTSGKTDDATFAQNASREARSELRSRLHQTFDTATGGEFFGVEVKRISEETLTEIDVAASLADASDSSASKRILCQWEIFRTMVPEADSTVLWKTTNGEPLLVHDEMEYDTHMYALHSGYPLLNGALVNSQNRRLVDQLIEYLSPQGKVAIVTSTRLMDAQQGSQLWKFLQVFPHPWIAGQLLLTIILFCLWRFPIFGRPRTEISDDLKRFGSHVEALGDLLRRTGKRSFAVKRIKEWKKRRSPKSHHGASE